MTVDAHDVGLRRRAVTHVGNLADGDQRAVDGLDRQVVKLIDGLGAVVEQDGVFVGAELGSAHRNDLILQRQGIAHILGRQAFGSQRLRVEVEGDLTLLATHRCGHGQAGQGAQRQADVVLHQVADLGFREAWAGKRHLQDRHRGRAVVEDQRRRDARRHLLEHGL